MSSSSVFDSLYSSPFSASASASSSAIYDFGSRRSAYASSPYSPGYSTTYGSSYGSGGNISSGGGSRSSSNSYDKYYSYFDDLPSLKRDRYTSSRVGGDYGGGGGGSSSRYSSSLSSSYTPRYLMSSDLLGLDSKSGGGSLRKEGGKLRDQPNYDRLGRQLSNYDRWKVQKAGDASSGEVLDASFSSSSDVAASTGKSSFLSASNSGGRRRQRGVRFAEDVVSVNGSGDGGGGDDDDVVNLDDLRDMTVGPSNLSSSSSVRGSRAVSLKPELTSSFSSSSSYKPSFGSSSYSSSISSYRSFPSGVADKLAGYDIQDVKGDGGCYYRCLSLYFTGSESNYMKYRREVLDYIRENLDNYSTMIRSELTGSARSTSDYFQRKTRADRQDWAETTEIIATCCVYNINVHVLALVPGRLSAWQWLHFDPSIGTGRPSRATRDVHLYNAGSVHFMLCTPKSERGGRR